MDTLSLIVSPFQNAAAYLTTIFIRPRENSVVRESFLNDALISQTVEPYNSGVEEMLRSLLGIEQRKGVLAEEEAAYMISSITVPSGETDLATHVASLPDLVFPRFRMIVPKKTKILALDLDETLVHSTSKSSSDYDFFIEVMVDRSSCLYYVHKRPFLDHFLETVSSWYHLVIYTASMKEYADPLVNYLDQGRCLFKKRLFRNVQAHEHLNFRLAWSRWGFLSRT